MVSLGIAVIAGLAVGAAFIIMVTVGSAQTSNIGTPQKVWVAMNTTQCNEVNPSQLLRLEGVQAYQTETHRWAEPGMGFCEACGCPSGFTNYYEIDESALPKALKNGFKVESPPQM